jgi:SAM-dependent methyltransferase
MAIVGDGGTMQLANTGQDRAWNGPEGQHWADHADDLNGEFTAHLADAAGIGPGDWVLDIGCGTGGSTRHAARRAVGGAAVGIDLSAPMLAKASQYADRDGLTNIRFDRGDAQRYPFPGGWFNVAISQFGVMFFDDPVAAFANIGRALRPGGRLAFVCPAAADDCDWYRVPIGALTPEPAEPAAPTPNEGMFALADPARIESILTAAGYDTIRSQRLDTSIHFGPDLPAAVDFFIGSGPVRALREAGTVTDADLRPALTEALLPYTSTTGVRVPGRHWLVQAVNSAITAPPGSVTSTEVPAGPGSVSALRPAANEVDRYGRGT